MSLTTRGGRPAMLPASRFPLGRFSALQRLVHWLMAVAIVAMLFIGVGMVATVAPVYTLLLAIHRPLGFIILVLALARLALRFQRGVPALPTDLPDWMAWAAHASHVALYAMMIAMPLLGWAMLSAGGYPIVLYGRSHLPAIMPHDALLYTLLHTAHVGLAFVLFATILAHVAAALFHGLYRRDGVFAAMAPFWRK